MKWFKRWVLRKAEGYAIEESIRLPKLRNSNSIGTVATAGSELNAHGMNFKIYKASGGTIIETNQYNHRTDRHSSGLYIITDEKDLGKELGKIITMESLKV